MDRFKKHVMQRFYQQFVALITLDVIDLHDLTIFLIQGRSHQTLTGMMNLEHQKF